MRIQVISLVYQLFLLSRIFKFLFFRVSFLVDILPLWIRMQEANILRIRILSAG